MNTQSKEFLFYKTKKERGFTGEFYKLGKKLLGHLDKRSAPSYIIDYEKEMEKVYSCYVDPKDVDDCKKTFNKDEFLY